MIVHVSSSRKRFRAFDQLARRLPVCSVMSNSKVPSNINAARCPVLAECRKLFNKPTYDLCREEFWLRGYVGLKAYLLRYVVRELPPYLASLFPKESDNA